MFLASLSVITPLEVETMAMPKPFKTLGIASTPEYLRKPGVDTRCKLRMAGVLVTGWYLRAILIKP